MQLPTRGHLVESALADPGASRLLLLNAPVGYGKNAAVKEWVSQRPEDEVHWIHCTASMSFDTVSDAARARESSHTLILSSYESITSARNDLAVAELVARHPNLTLIVITRRVHTLDSPLAAATAPMATIDQAQLELTADEIGALAEAAPHSVELRAALDQAAGWPLAVQAVLSAQNYDDPLAAIDRLAYSFLEVLSVPAREVALVASLLDATSLELAAHAAELSLPEARAATQELGELGLLSRHLTARITEFRCHPSVRVTLARRAERSYTPEQRVQLQRARAEEVEHIQPFSAFFAYCRMEDFAAAELVLMRHFTSILTHDTDVSQVLREVPDDVLASYPAFSAARLFLDAADPLVSTETLAHLTERMRVGTEQRLAQGTSQLGESLLPTLCMAMTSERLSGDFERAADLAQDLEQRLTDATHPNPGGSSSSFAIYRHQLALNALAFRDLEGARRNYERIRLKAERAITAPWTNPIGASTAETVRHGRRLQLLAMDGLALVEALDGNVRYARDLLAESDSVAAAGAIEPSGSSWITGELARFLIANEEDERAMLRQATERIDPVADRIEQWQLLLMLRVVETRKRQGLSWAISRMHSELQQREVQAESAKPSPWDLIFARYRVMLYIVSGDFTSARAILERQPSVWQPGEIELARLALYNDDSASALILAQRANTSSLPQRAQLNRLLIAACASWDSGHSSEAITSLAEAAELLTHLDTRSVLWDVPWETLRLVAEAAAEAEQGDYRELVQSVPETVRTRKYEQLTQMELRSLEESAVKRSINYTASSMHLSSATVKKHLGSVYRKLRVSNREEAIVQANRMEILAAPTAAP